MAARQALTKGWRFKAHSGNLRKALSLEEFQISASGAQSVLVQMQASPVSQLDFEQIRGTARSCPPVPATAGVTGVGTVTSVGNDCKNMKEGDRVIISSGFGSWAGHVVAEEADLIKVPNTIPVEYAAVLAAGPIAACHILKNSGLTKGDVVIVNGAGTLMGLSVLQLAKYLGFVGVGISNDQKEVQRLKQMGLDASVDTTESLGPNEPKIAIDLLGGESSAHLARLIGSQGQIISLGSSSVHLFANSDLVDKELTLQGFSVSNWLQKEDPAVLNSLTEEVCSAIEQKKLTAPISKHPLANLQVALEELSEEKTIVLMHD